MSPAANNVKDGGVKKGGHIELILGPMFSGKSTELMRRLKRYKVSEGTLYFPQQYIDSFNVCRLPITML